MKGERVHRCRSTKAYPQQTAIVPSSFSLFSISGASTLLFRAERPGRQALHRILRVMNSSKMHVISLHFARDIQPLCAKRTSILPSRHGDYLCVSLAVKLNRTDVRTANS